MNNGIINLDTDFANKIGFTSDKFDGWLWKNDKTIIISFICSKCQHQGNLRKLLDNIEALDFYIQVPTPSNRMVTILKKRNYHFAKINTEMGECIILTNEN